MTGLICRECSAFAVVFSLVSLGGCALGSVGPAAPEIVGAPVERIIPLGRVEDDPAVRLASYGDSTKPPKSPSATVDIEWDAEVGISQLFVHTKSPGQRLKMPVDELKAWLQPIARSDTDEKTKLSNASLLIRCDRRAPFRFVQEVMVACAHKDVQLYRISMAVESRLSLPLPVDSPVVDTVEELEPEEKIQVRLAMRGDQCICFVNGRSVGILPQARSEMSQAIKRYRFGDDTTVEISTDPRVKHQDLIHAIEACRRAKLKNVTLK